MTTWQTITTTVQSLAALTQFVLSAAGWYTIWAENAYVKRELYDNITPQWVSDAQTLTTASCISLGTANFCRLNNVHSTLTYRVIVQYSAPY